MFFAKIFELSDVKTIETLKSDLETAKKDAADKADDLKNCQANLSDQASDLGSKLNDCKSSAKDLVDEADKKLAESESKVQSLTRDLDAANESLKKDGTMIAELNEKLRALSSETNKLSSSDSDESHDLSSCLRKLKEVKSEATKAVEEAIAKATACRDEQTKEAAALSTGLKKDQGLRMSQEECEASLVADRKKLAADQTALGSLTEELKGALGRVTKLNHALENARNDLAKEEKILAEKQAAVAADSSSKQKIESELAACKQRHMACAMRVKKLESELNSEQGKMEDLASRVAAADARAKANHAALLKSNADLIGLRVQAKKDKATVSDLTKEDQAKVLFPIHFKF